MTAKKRAAAPKGALADEFPAIAQLYNASPPYAAASAAAVTALAADVHKAVDALLAARTALTRFQTSQPFGPGYRAGYTRALAEAAPELARCLDTQTGLIAAARALTALVDQFDPESYSAADMFNLIQANDAVQALLPVVPQPAPAPEPVPGPVVTGPS
jgi:hypothetical protein